MRVQRFRGDLQHVGARDRVADRDQALAADIDDVGKVAVHVVAGPGEAELRRKLQRVRRRPRAGRHVADDRRAARLLQRGLRLGHRDPLLVPRLERRREHELVVLVTGDLVPAVLGGAHAVGEQLGGKPVGQHRRLHLVLVEHVEEPPDAVARAVFAGAERHVVELVVRVRRHRPAAMPGHRLPFVQHDHLHGHARPVGPGPEPVRAGGVLRAQIPLVDIGEAVRHWFTCGGRNETAAWDGRL